MSFTCLIIPLILALGVTLCSYLLGQQTSKEMLIAIIRVVLQLLLMGYALTWIFKNQNIYVMSAAVLIMTFNAALNVRGRVKYKYPGIFLDNFTCLIVAILPLSFIGASSIFGQELTLPQYFLPLLGMLLGNSLTGLSLGIDFFTRDLKEKKDNVLSLIALGATPKESTRELFNHSLRYGLTPTINAMVSMGVVTIPGMMTGQLISGVSPQEAVVVQIAMMLLVVTGSYSGLVISLILARRRFFSERGELCF